jgi:hypothetical protein
LSGLFIGDSMDRQIIYPGQLLPETTLLQMTKDSMIGAAKLASALLGSSTMASGFAVTPTGPASLQVLCAPGEIYSLAVIDSLVFSTLPADTTHSILKQGILLDGVTLSCPAPGTTGQSINYLVQVTYQDTDATPVLLPYYNSANPALPYSGQGNNGLTQNTVRKGSAVVAVKAGASATTGSQVTPAPDAGYIGLYAVTVAFGQTTITAGSIAALATAPIINSTLHGLAPVFNASLTVGAATAAGHALQLGQATGRLINVQYITSTGTYTPTAGTRIVEVELVGGGGAGGGTPIPGAGNVSAGAGGGGGGYARKLITSGFSGVTVTIGAGGTGALGAAGGNGGNTSFGAIFSATGGTGGSVGPIAVATAQPVPNGIGVGGSGVGGDINAAGGLGMYSFLSAQPTSGKGGSTQFGEGARYQGATNNGIAGGANSGTGGSGSAATAGAPAATGGSGGTGLCVVREYS